MVLGESLPAQQLFFRSLYQTTIKRCKNMKKLLSVMICFLLIRTILSAATIEGTVTDSTTGQPILGASIVFTTNPVSSRPDGIEYSTRTDSSGFYRITNVKPGIYVILIEHKKYQPYFPEKLLISDSSDTVIDFSFKLIPYNFPPVKTGKISGRVTYDESESDAPVMGAYVSAVPSGKEMFIEPWIGDFAVSDSSGNYSLKLPEGNYKVLCYIYNHYGYYQEYYDNVSNPKDAKDVTVIADGNTEDINFGIPKFAEDTSVINISGKVTDSKGNPLVQAFVRVEFPDIYTFRYDPMMDMTTTTDENGKYLISFPQYKAYFAKNCIVYSKKEDYDVEFYKEKKNYYEASRLNFDSSKTFEDIDFTLDPFVNELHSISGIVKSESGEPIQSAMVIGMSAESNQFHYAISDSSGIYSIPNLPIGKYYVLFVAKWYVPEFYDNALKWENAIALGVTKDFQGIDASLSKITTPADDTSLVVITGYIKSPDDIPLPGAVVTATSSDNVITGYAITDAEGAFKIEGLTKGNYNIQASLVNYVSKNESVTVGSSRSTQVLNFAMKPASVTSVYEKPKLSIPEKLQLVQNHPNPFNPSTIITFTLPNSENVVLKVYNIIGQEVVTLVSGRLNAGTYRIPFDAKGLGSGVYLYQLKTGSVSIVKKMLLTK